MIYKFKILLFTIILSFSDFILLSQDTVTVMQYNLLHYDISPAACIPIAEKTGYIKTICKHVKPDILGVNEMYPSYSTIDYLLNNALNTDGISYYKRSSYTNLATGSELVNVLYYNDNKFGLISNTPIQTIIRDINLFRLFYRSPNLATTQDTIYLYVVIAHLKASQGYEAQRATMTNDLMNYLNSINAAKNYLMQGDFNLYSSTEAAYQNLISHANANIRFYDPINRAGNWSANYSYKDIHTQSTHNTGSSCFITGGMDDRFDFILISNDIRVGNKKVSYIPGSYKAVGQDGLHFNNDINASSNNSVTSEVMNALYNNSDHLPVSLKLKINYITGVEQNEPSDVFNIEVANPFSDKLEIWFNSKKQQDCIVQVYNPPGSICFESNLKVSVDENYFSIPVNLQKGFYFLKITGKNNKSIVKKIIRD